MSNAGDHPVIGFVQSAGRCDQLGRSVSWCAVAVCVAWLTGCEQSERNVADPAAAPPGTGVEAPAGSTPAVSATPAAKASRPLGPPLGQIESLVAPVALYPDPLLAELLVASTYPVEIVQAARWLDSHPDLTGLKDQSWDPSVQRLSEVPSIIPMMSAHLDWTTALGNAFLEDPDAVLGAVQDLRGRAVDSGFLTDTPQQKVERKTVRVPAQAPTSSGGSSETAVVRPAVVRQEIVSIQPAQQDTLYVPQYSAQAAYEAPLAPPSGVASSAVAEGGYYPAYTPPAPAAGTESSSSVNPWLMFGAGALVGGLVTWGIMELADDDDWDDGYWGGGYYRGPVRVVHHYGDAVCYSGTCWNGGGYRGAGYRGDVNVDRGDVNLNRQVNVSGNTVSGDRTFKLSQLQRTDRVWHHDGEHRRGQRYTDKAKERIGEWREPGLAGSRPGGWDGVRSGDRGTLEGRLPGAVPGRPTTLPAKKPPSSEEVRAKLAHGRTEGAAAGAREKLAEHVPQPAKRDGSARTAGTKLADRAGGGVGAFSGIRERAGETRDDSKRGKLSRDIAQGKQKIGDRHASGSPASRPGHVRQPAPERGGALADKAGSRIAERHSGGGGLAQRAQHADPPRRSDGGRSGAFGGQHDGGRAREFSQRGAASRQQSIQAHRAGNRPAASSGAAAINRGGGAGGGRGRRR